MNPVKSRTPRQKTSTWIAPGLGALGGFLYATIDEQLLQAWFGVTTPQAIVIAHDFVDFVLPVFFGILVGFAVNTIQKQARTNYNLSIRNEKLQKDLLVNTLTSLFLHEIRNPLHNIAAALDDDRIQLPKETEVILKRNLTRLDQSTLQYRKWSSLFNKIHPKEKTELRSWLSEFIENKVRSQLIELEIKYSLAIPPI